MTSPLRTGRPHYLMVGSWLRILLWG